LNINRIKQIAEILEIDFLELISLNKGMNFSNFEEEPQNYKQTINNLEEEINFFKNEILKKLDQK